MGKCDLMVQDGALYLWGSTYGIEGAGLPVEKLPKVLRPKFKKDGRYQLTGYVRARKGLVNFQVQYDEHDIMYHALYVDGGCAICDEFLEAILGEKRAAKLEDSGVETAHVKIVAIKSAKRPGASGYKENE